jgi:hypothetical protein
MLMQPVNNPAVTPDASSPPPVPLDNGLHDYLIHDSTSSIDLNFDNAQLMANGCAPSTDLVVHITLDDGSAGRFLNGLTSQTFALYPGETKDIKVTMADLSTGTGPPPDYDSLFGVKVTVSYSAGDGTKLSPQPAPFFIYRYVERGDDNDSDGLIKFPDTIGDGMAHRDRMVQYAGDPQAEPSLVPVDPTNFKAVPDPASGGTLTDLEFVPQQPSSAGIGVLPQPFMTPLQIVNPSDPGVAALGGLFLDGLGTPKEHINVNLAGLEAALQEIADNADTTTQQVSLTVNQTDIAHTFFTLSFRAESTSVLRVTDSAQDVASALNRLSTLSGNTVTVDRQDETIQNAAPGTSLNPSAQERVTFTIHFPASAGPSYAGGVVPTLGINVSGATAVLASPATYTVTLTSATGNDTGTGFSMSFNGQSTGVLPFNATAAQVQAALEGPAGLGRGNVAVTQVSIGNGLPATSLFKTIFSVQFQNALSGTTTPLTVTTNNTPASSVAGLLIPATLITPNERALFDTPDERAAIATAVEASLASLFAPFSEGIDVGVVTAPGDNTVTINWRNLVSPGDSLWGNSLVPGGLGIDADSTAIQALLAQGNRLTPTAADYLLSKALNQASMASVEVYPNNILAWLQPGGPLELNQAQLINALAVTAAHEIGHSIGAFHTAMLTDASKTPAIQTVTLTGGSATDAFTLSFAGQTTGALLRNAQPSDVQDALENLGIVPANYVSVTGQPGGPYTVTFTGPLNGIQVPQITGAPFGTGGVITVSTTIDQVGSAVPVYGKNTGTNSQSDVMATGNLDFDGSRKFLSGYSDEVLRLGLHLNWTPAQAQTALAFFARYFSTGVFLGAGPDPDETAPAFPGRHLGVFDAAGMFAPGSQDLGPVLVDGPGGAQGVSTFTLTNYGSADLTLTGVEISGSGGALTVTQVAPGTVLHPGDSLPIQVTFDPLTPGSYAAELRIDSNDPAGPFVIELTGTGQSPAPHLVVTTANDNVGGAVVGAAAAVSPSFTTLANDGQQPLHITQVTIGSRTGLAQYTVTGLPAPLDATHPLVLNPGQSITLGVSFAPSAIGLQPGDIQVFSDDPSTPLFDQAVDGTGLAAMGSALHYGNDYVAVAITSEPNAPVFRQRSDDQGNFSFFLPPEQSFHAAIFDPISGLIANLYGVTAPSGSPTDLGTPVFQASTAPDTDGDGLPDDTEFAIGTSPTNRDTSGTGLGDFNAVEEGLDPLAGRGLATGVIASVALQGTAEQVVVLGSTTDPKQQTAYVAAGTSGLAIVDVSNPTKPVVVGQLAVPFGADAVAVDPTRAIAAVVAAGSDLHFVDVSDPKNPHVVDSVPLDAGLVVVADGVAYVTDGTNLDSYDLATHSQLGQLSFPGAGRFTGLARDGSTLYLMDANKVLRIIDASSLTMTARGSLTLPDGGGTLVAGNGIVYAAAATDFYGGFVTVDVSNPDQPVLISGSDVMPPNTLPGTAIAVNGSGKAVLVGAANLGGGKSAPGLTLMDLTNPAATDALLASFPLPVSARDVALASGVAYVADGTSGLEIVNFLPPDVAGVPPTASVSAPVADVDPNTPGIQVVEGSTIPIRADVSDDVQVRQVDLLVNGQVVQTSVSFPFNLSAVAPLITPQSSTFTVQVRATDTGNVSTLSDPLTIDLLPDNAAPTLVSQTPTDLAMKTSTFRTVVLEFSKPMAESSLTPSTVQVLDPNGQVVAPIGVSFLDGDSVAEFQFNKFAPATYELLIHAAQINDRVGHALGAADLISHFTIEPYSIQFVPKDATSNGFDLLDPLNWNLGRVPNKDDDVLIDDKGKLVSLGPSPANPVASLTVASLTETGGGTLQFNQVQLHVAGPLTFSGSLDIAGGSMFQVAGPLTFSGSLDLVGGSMLQVGGALVVHQDMDLAIDPTGTPLLVAGSTVEVDGTLSFSNGILRGGTLIPGANTVVESSLGTLDGVTVNGNIDTTRSPMFSGFTIVNNFTMNGTWTDAIFDFHGVSTLGGNGTLVNPIISAERGNAGGSIGPPAALTISSTMTLHGYVIINSGDDSTILNQGTIIADTDMTDIEGRLLSSYVSLGPDQVGPGAPNDFGLLQNVGTIEVQNGAHLEFRAGGLPLEPSPDGPAVQFVSTGMLRATGGGFLTFALSWSSRTTIVDSGATLNSMQSTLVTPAGQTATFSGGGSWLADLAFSFQGGTVNLTGGAVITPAPNNPVDVFLDGVTFNGNIDASNGDGWTLTVQKGVTFNGTATPSTAPGLLSQLFFEGDGATLNGNANLNFGPLANIGTETDPQNPSVLVLHATIGPSVSMQGSIMRIAGFDTFVSGAGQVSSDITNHGTITVSGGTLKLQYVLNPDGTIQATNETINVENMPAADVARIARTGGTLNVVGPLDNTGATLQLNAATGSWNLMGFQTGVGTGKISGGTIDTADGAGLIIGAGTPGGALNASLDGVTFNGTLDLATVANANLTVAGGFTLSGTALLGPSAQLQVGQPGEPDQYTQTATGTLDVTLDGSVAGNSTGLINAGGGSVTLDGTLTVHLASGYMPKLGDRFRIVTCASRTGQFATINGLSLGNGLALQAVYDPDMNGLTLVVVSG